MYLITSYDVSDTDQMIMEIFIEDKEEAAIMFSQKWNCYTDESYILNQAPIDFTCTMLVFDTHLIAMFTFLSFKCGQWTSVLPQNNHT